jgi:hypothetical protein
MARYYFHPHNTARRLEDLEGGEFPSLDAAKADALDAIREFWSQAMLRGQDLGGMRLEIADEGGATLAMIPFDAGLPASLQARLVGSAG